MPYVAPGTVAAGDVYTAAAHNIQVNNVIQIASMAQGVFSTETARDAAITVPVEGMMAYLQTPSTAVANATGQMAAIPSGVHTIYNGSVWVVVTPIGAQSRANAVGASNIYTTSTSYVTGASGVTGDTVALTVSLITGTSALIMIDLTHSFSTSNSAFSTVSVSGVTTIAASDVGCTASSGSYGTSGASFILTGLVAGLNTFTHNVKTDGNTLYLTSRRLVVRGVA